MMEFDEQSAAGPVRILTREEIDELVRQGKITSIEQIPLYHQETRVSFPEIRYGHARCC